MMPTLTFDTNKTALLIMDVQNDQVRRIQETGQRPDLLQKICSVLDVARQAGMLVIYVVARFRPGHPEAHPKNRFQQMNKRLGRLLEGTLDAEIHAEVAPQTGDLVVVKRRVNAFFNTDLSILLNARGIETLVLAGIATSGVILSSTRYAGDADYELVILDDCCADPNPEVHSFLIEKILPFQATIANAQDFLKAVAGA
jgi:nicotinamidase-related amidase